LVLAFLLAALLAKQGDVIRITAAKGEKARLGEKTVPLFKQKSGELLGLLPVPVTYPPGLHKIAVLDENGIVQEIPVQIRDARFPRQNIRATPGMQALKALPGEMETMRELPNTLTPERFWGDTLKQATAGCMSSPFGVARYHNNKPTGNYHRGVDIRAPEGQPVRAPAGGTVKVAKLFRLHGGTIGVDHGQGVTSSYIHLSKLVVEEGDSVKQGDVVGYVGSTGFATGPHLHWSLYVNGLPVNPRQWVPTLSPCGRK
jgi:murein DD-endopeptidase MepM/ murein hydrolase activator NlpD